MGGIMGNTAKQPTAAGSLQFQSAQRGGIIPLVYGTTRVAANIIDYDDFKSFMVNAQNAGKGKGGGGGKTGKNQEKITEYSVSFILGFCQGPISAVGQGWYDKYISYAGDLGGYISSINFGADGQSPDPYWASNHSFKALGYSGTMNIAFANRNLGPSTTLPNFSIEVYAIQAGSAPNGMDASPPQIIYDFLTNPRYGAGFPTANLDTQFQDITDPTSYASYVRALGIWMSLSIETQQEAQQQLDAITKLTDSEIVWSGGLLKIKPRGDTQVIGSITSNSSWTITLDGGDIHGGDTFNVTISDPAFGTQLAYYTGFTNEHLSDVGAGLAESLSGIVSSFNITIAAVVSAETPQAPPPASQNNSSIVVISMFQNPPTGNTNVTVSTGSSAATISISTTASGGIGTYTPNLQAVYSLTDNDFIVQETTVGTFLGPTPGGDALRSGATPITGGFTDDPVHIQRSSPADAVNKIQLEVLDRGAYYNSAIVEVSDQAAIDLYGMRVDTSVNARSIVDPGYTGYTVAQLLLQRSLMFRNTYTFQLGWNYILLEPMDLVQITDSRLGAAALTVRITGVEEDEEGTLTITAEDFFGAYNPNVLYPKAAPVGQTFLPVTPTVLGSSAGGVPIRSSIQMNMGYVPNQGTQVGSINAPIIFEPTNELLTSPSTALEIWVAMSSTYPSWGGAAIFMSLDGTSYASVGQVIGNSVMGLTVADLPNFTSANPDLTSILKVDLTESAGVLTSVTSAVASNFMSLVYVGPQFGGGELLSYQTATLTAANKYSLTVLYRGGFGTTVADHPLGSYFTQIGGSIARIPFSSSLIGQTVYFKFASFNSTFGAQQDISTLTAYPYTITGAGQAVQSVSITSSVSGKPGSGATLQTYVFGQSETFPAGLVGSFASAGTAATSTATFHVQKNASNIGTMVFATGATTATFTLSSATTFNGGDVFTLIAPSPQDGTLANVGWTFIAHD